MDLATVHTARLRGERMTIAHEPDVRVMHEDQDLMRYLGGVRGMDDTVRYLERNIAHWDQHGFGMWILRDRASGRLVGRGGLRHLDVGVDEIEIGYAILPELWGNGLATEIARACLAIARDELGAETVVTDARPDNIASRRVMEKVGLVYERDIDLDGIRLALYRSGPLTERSDLEDCYRLPGRSERRSDT